MATRISNHEIALQVYLALVDEGWVDEVGADGKRISPDDLSDAIKCIEDVLDYDLKRY